jgi:TRAP-type C4-dicarboxylate transport system substrate-binding protein
VAPFLVDTLSLERQALASPLAAGALAGLDRDGVVGVALLPGPLRRPLGLTRPLVRPPDYRAETIGIRPGGVAAATFRALGATAEGYVPGDVSTRLDGVELDLLTITENSYDEGARALTADVVFWPKPQTIVMNSRAFGGLSRGQRRMLLEAGRQAVGRELVRVARAQRLGLSILCQGPLPLVVAGPAARVALRRAVQPVYDRLRRDPLTRRWIDSILRQRAATPAAPDTLRCP